MVLDYEYSPSQWSKRGKDECISHHLTWTADESKKVRESLECELDIVYGTTEGQKMDIFGASTLPKDAPVFVFIHGGYWSALSKNHYSYVAVPLLKAGAVTVIIEYDLAPTVDMDTIISEIRDGMKYILNFASKRKSRGVYLSGHSAGGHLVAMALSYDWMSECSVNSDLIKGAIFISGVFDLRPLVDSYVNDPLKMDEENAWKNSPMKYLDCIIQKSKTRKILVTIAEDDPKEFHRQSQEMFQFLEKGGVKCEYLSVAGADHFEIVERLISTDYVLTQVYFVSPQTPSPGSALSVLVMTNLLPKTEMIILFN